MWLQIIGPCLYVARFILIYHKEDGIPGARNSPEILYAFCLYAWVIHFKNKAIQLIGGGAGRVEMGTDASEWTK